MRISKLNGNSGCNNHSQNALTLKTALWISITAIYSNEKFQGNSIADKITVKRIRTTDWV